VRGSSPEDWPFLKKERPFVKKLSFSPHSNNKGSSV
jgi:hypothetical protein